jgi:hypothetical protein
LGGLSLIIHYLPKESRQVLNYNSSEGSIRGRTHKETRTTF